MPPRGQTVVVTGASAGVGRATAVAFAKRGWNVALLARGEAGLAGAAVDVEAAGGRALVCPTDVADADAVMAAMRRTEAELGPIDVWVNNAMTTVFARSWDVSPDEFRRTTEVTYLGQVYGTLAALEVMRPRDRGVIVNVGSALAFRAIPLQAAYCGAKFAGRGFTEAVRTELLADGSNVQLTTVHLPAVDTPQFGWCLNRLPKHPQPVAPIYGPEVPAEAIVRAALHPRRAKLLGGCNQFLVLANKVAPGIVDHYVARTSIAAQQTDLDADPSAPASLWAPVDGERDVGARGIFSEQEGGMRTVAFWASVPKLAFDTAAAAVDRAGEVGRQVAGGPGRRRGRRRRRRRR
jgi:NAD(P)-dependent dehydrogenase (short-subunit alcohol dehydrogenase family)